MTNEMMHPTQTRPVKSHAEDGYLLVAVIFMLFLLVLSLSVALPKVREDIQRDRDLETMHRGQQYQRGIQLYFRKFNRYPPNVDALLKTNEIRFLRKKYIDPTTGKGDWKPILFGKNQTPLAVGFFGKPLAGMALAGMGPSGGNGLAGTSTPDSNTATSGTGATTGPGANGGSLDSLTGTSSGSGPSPTGQTFGGAGIIGFSPASPKQSILVYKKKNHYNEWEFLYSPLADRMTNINNSPSQLPLQGGAPGAPAPTSPLPTPGPTTPQ